jgi:hypothetical protein
LPSAKNLPTKKMVDFTSSSLPTKPGPSVRLVIPEVRLFLHLLVEDSHFGYKQKFLKENSS